MMQWLHYTQCFLPCKWIIFFLKTHNKLCFNSNDSSLLCSHKHNILFLTGKQKVGSIEFWTNTLYIHSLGPTCPSGNAKFKQTGVVHAYEREPWRACAGGCRSVHWRSRYKSLIQDRKQSSLPPTLLFMSQTESLSYLDQGVCSGLLLKIRRLSPPRAPETLCLCTCFDACVMFNDSALGWTET